MIMRNYKKNHNFKQLTGSTEVFHHGQSRWREITGLPCASRGGPRGATLGNTVYMFVCQAQILRLDTAVEEWINVGEMVGERSDHAVSVVSVDNYCSSISSSYAVIILLTQLFWPWY